MPRTLAIGDIHGWFSVLMSLAEFVPFRDDDRLIFLGDYIDRGPESNRVIEWLMDRVHAQRAIALRGNHEIMMLAALLGEIPMQHWLQFGGRDVLKSYAKEGRQGTSDDIPIEHLRFLHRELHPYFETATHLFVHATLTPDLSPDQQSERALYWDKFDGIAPHSSGKTIICGHTAQHSGRPLNVGYAVCIDTWVYGDGWLTCLDVESGTYWQANQQGQTRSETLPPPQHSTRRT